jgi:hypothetical protein
MNIMSREVNMQPMRSVTSTNSRPGPLWFSPRRLKPSPVLTTYWRFACERQRIFFRRVLGQGSPWTSDAILRSHRFTNVYRASDRVSQYLIRTVIPGSSGSAADLFFRTILFKMFNRISTWELLTAQVGDLHVDDFDVEHYDRLLTTALASGERLYSAAYIMPMPRFGYRRKHTNHLRLLKSMLVDELPARLAEARSMKDAYHQLLQYPSIGPFLAFQYLIDLNYSDLLNFSEMDFVVAGPGAIDGIAKCFVNPDCFAPDDIIKATAEMAHTETERLGLPFLSLWSRPLQLIDCQNLFCEIDKYSRVAHPEARGRSGRTRIKQLYRYNSTPVQQAYPTKWRIVPSLDWEPLKALLRRVSNSAAEQVTVQPAPVMVSQAPKHTAAGDQGLLPLPG